MLLDLMLKFYAQAQLFFRRKDGASGIEYAIIVAMVALVIVAAGAGLGDKITSIFDKVSNGMTSS
ncbi:MULTISPECIES: Flp family type IVb pilin [Pseudomonas]|uniref:Flp family type IVb pilin n=1 Tax=Pseudomonas azadiae TaxID=2843612 RepID=A0ABS6NTU5_9PSED|nr:MULTISPECIES: Flp family type IVb pilin [Pseudomonas]MBV4451414.1 Flp family type IVb pilin [Pseudomonas azadiae]NMF40080.1 Flp family type IVb pilin [Pseudomonas sp. SWRI 103]